ncbi:hypothetical protein ASPSYDRAFT_44710 [Aspergillus sydowii CBS 593.65]|uniref:Uncharacterized protein n=1 Tax=Aspergillus sydowii CBS 593.65 TaxID=1036612 RepID=A0A1L9TLK8_9EURO|nr:uncharacterized protein ASPSYDRAFT_44710 [Aspergillus sydowii CBS 593.65]OJJ60272.1 hypothetical protein ASPSYDRAFT_44710 [Aspergillus sydowii CBS 593.65]
MQLLNLLVLAFVGSAIAIPGPPQKNELNGFEKRACIPQFHRCGDVPGQCCAPYSCTSGGCA